LSDQRPTFGKKKSVYKRAIAISVQKEAEEIYKKVRGATPFFAALQNSALN
jgi:hypothetical protein